MSELKPDYLTITATVIDEDTMRYGGSAFKRERTCHIIAKPSDSDYANHWHFLCSNCGCPIEVDEIEQNGDEPPTVIGCENYCGTCGARVERDA